MDRDIDRAERRTRQYWYEDGLAEIAAGCLFVAIGLLFLLEALSPPGSLPRSFSAIGIMLLLVGGLWIANWAVRLAKNRITFPRTGYVRYRRPARSGRRKLLTAALAVGIGVSVSLLLNVLAPTSLAWIPALQGLFIGLFILYMAYQVGLARFYLLAVLSFAVGAGAALSGAGDTLGNGIYFLTMGAALLVSGVLTLIGYLRHTTPSEGE